MFLKSSLTVIANHHFVRSTIYEKTIYEDLKVSRRANFDLNFRWNFVVGLMPMWIAPNLITIIGLAVNVFTSLLLLYYCPTATEEVSF